MSIERKRDRSGSGRSTHDVELVERIATGDGQALGQLYDRFSSLLLALIRRIVGNQEEAEDILQEVLLQAWNQAGRYDPKRSSVSTWLVLIARSRSIDRLRSRQVVERTAKAAHEEDPREDESPEAMGNVLHRERRFRLRAELEKLPPEQQQVLELAFFRGLTQSEISSSADIPLGTVKTRTLLAMKKLRKALHRELGDLL